MPIPIIIWGVAAAGGALGLWAWKKKSPESFDTAMNKAGEILSKGMEPIVKDAETKVNHLLTLDNADGEDYLKRIVPKMDLLNYSAFKTALQQHCKESYSFKAIQFLAQAEQLREGAV